MAQFGCQVTLVDPTETYVQASETITARMGLADRLAHRLGSALAIPFDDGSFDLVWTQNSGMNIADKERLYAELHRVRIRTKQLRYTAELADQAPDVQLGELVRAAKQLQTVLGDHQDACVARDRVRQLLADAPGTDTASAAELLAGAEEQRRRRCRAAWPGKWRELLAAAQECGISG